MRQKNHQYDCGQVKNDAHNDRGEEQRHRCDRRHFVTSKNIFLALLHGAHARAEEAAAENANCRHHCDHDYARASLLRIKGVTKNEKEHQRKEIIEEQDGAVPSRELQIDLEEGEKGFHLSRAASSRLAQ